jgi:hypothetical protein
MSLEHGFEGLDTDLKGFFPSAMSMSEMSICGMSLEHGFEGLDTDLKGFFPSAMLRYEMSLEHGF